MTNKGYTLTFFGSDPHGVQSAKAFTNLIEAERYATDHLALMVARGKSFRSVYIFEHNGLAASVAKVVKA